MLLTHFSGQIGFTAVLMPGYPNTTSSEDVYAAAAYNALQAGVVLDPVVHGDYSQVCKPLLSGQNGPQNRQKNQNYKIVSGPRHGLKFSITLRCTMFGR